MDINSNQALIPFEEALRALLEEVTASTGQELISLFNACDRISASAITSPINVPPFANSAMDGFAIRFDDFTKGKVFSVAGKAFAGSPFNGEWPCGSCIRIMTGASIPTGADTVIMQEEADITDDGILFIKSPIKGQNVRLAGEDILQNSVVLPAGVKLSASHLPLLASLGISEIPVYRRLKVAIFSTGDELQSIGNPLQPGQIYDTNRFAIRLMLQKMGCDVLDLGIIRDNEEVLREVFRRADSEADLVISSGGVSVGEADYTKQILDETGIVHFWKLAIKPGKPFAFGRLQNAWFCGLPGNPVSAVVTFYQLVQPLIAKLSGNTEWQRPARIKAKAGSKLKKSPGRLDFQRGVLTYDAEGAPVVHSTGHQGSHVFSSFSQGNCFIVLEQERGNVSVGEWVEVELFNTLLREV